MTAWARYLHALDLIGTDDGSYRLAQLEGRPSGIGADIIERPHLHRLDDAFVVEGDIHIEDALGPVRVSRPHVLQPVLDEAHGPAEYTGKMRGEHGLLDTALDPVAPAHVDILMDAHVVGWEVGEHERSGPDIWASGWNPRRPACHATDPIPQRRRTSRSERWSCGPTRRGTKDASDFPQKCFSTSPHTKVLSSRTFEP